MGLEGYSSILSVLAELGFAPDSSAVFAARAAHHSARLLYEATQGELLVTLLSGTRWSNNAVMLYVCESVERALQRSDMANFSTGMKLIFFASRSLLVAGAARGGPGGQASSGALGLGSGASVQRNHGGDAGGAMVGGGAGDERATAAEGGALAAVADGGGGGVRQGTGVVERGAFLGIHLGAGETGTINILQRLPAAAALSVAFRGGWRGRPHWL